MASEPAVAEELPGSGEPPKQAQRGVFDKWLVWGIAVSSIALPAFFLVLISSVESASLDFADFKAAAGHGEFLIPDAFLLVECCRRLAREVRPKRKFFQGLRLATALLCSVPATACLVASVILAIDATSKTTKSAIFMTLWFSVTGVLAGTIAVAVKGEDH